MNIYGLKTVNDIDIDNFLKMINLINNGEFDKSIMTDLKIQIKNNKIYFNDILISSELQTEFNKYISLQNLLIEHDLINNYDLKLNSEFIAKLVNIKSYQINTILPINATSKSIKNLIINTPTQQITLHTLPTAKIISVVNNINKTFENAYENFNISETSNKKYGVYDTSITSISSYTKENDQTIYLVNCPICESVENNAFISCTSLTQVIFPKCKIINNQAFENAVLNSVYCPNCESIGSYAFNHNQLTQINFPKCKSVENNAFMYNPLTQASLPKCESIGDECFGNCSLLTQLIISSLTSLGNNIFSGITTEDINVYIRTNNLNDFTETVKLIISQYTTMNKFYCYSNSTVPENPTFDDSNWTLITVLTETTITTNAYTSSTFTKAIAPNCTTIEQFAFENNTHISLIDCPICMSVSDSVFQNCTALTQASFPYCESIENIIFVNCTSLTQINFPECIMVNNSVFQNCTALTQASFPKCTNITNGAFDGCTSLAQLIISSSSSFDVGVLTPENINAYIRTNNLIDFNNTVQIIKLNYPIMNKFYYYSAQTVPENPSFDDPNWILWPTDTIILTDTTIIQNQYYNATFTSAIAPVCETIQNYAFYSTEGTTNTTITTINCPVCKKIGAWAFAKCTNLTTANFDECEIINDNAFNRCLKLNTIYFPECKIIENNAFDNCTKLTIINFPKCKLINDYAFSTCLKIKNADFPNCLTIGNYAFNGCQFLTTINFPNCNTINNNAFDSCKLLTTADFPSCIEIHDNAFKLCTSLTQCSLPNCTMLNNNAFDACALLTKLMISSLTSFGNNVFSNITTANLTVYILADQTNAELTKTLITSKGYSDITFKYYNSTLTTYPDFGDQYWTNL